MAEVKVREEEEGLSPRNAVARLRAAAVAAGRALVTSTRQHRWLVVLLLSYAVVLLVLRPLMPFEWDEVQFQRALDDYNVPGHSPHPPGYPAYVGAAKAVRLVVSNPLLALQLVGVAAAVGSLLLVWWFATRLGASPAAGAAAAVALGCVPTFAFHANVGLSDVAGATMGLAAVAAFVAAAENVGRLPWAALVAAVAFGVRPALLPLVLPLGLLALWRAVRARNWRTLAVAAVVGLVVTDLIWLPAMYASGPGFWSAWQTQVTYAAGIGITQRLPGAPLAMVLQNWFVRPFGSPVTAYALWALVLAGGALWWRAGCRRLVAVAASSAGAYLLVALFTLEAPVAVRYVLPAVPFLVLLAAGTVTVPGRVGRRLAIVAVAGWCAAALYWAAPVYALRRQPAPAWAALSWVREHFDPARTTVVYDGFFEPHAHYLLGGAGFKVLKAEQTTVYGRWLRPGGTVLYVSPKPVAGGEVLFNERWQSEKLRQMTRSRYDEGAVTQSPLPGEPVYSPDLRVRGSEWELYGTAAICLPEQAPPRTVQVAASATQLRVRRAGLPALTIKPGSSAEATVLPGDAGCLLLNGAAGVHSFLPPITTLPLLSRAPGDEVSSAAVVPLVARLEEGGRPAWRSDVYVHNVGTAALSLVAQYLPQGRDNSEAPTEAFSLPPGGKVVVTDVLRTTALDRWGSLGALLVYVDEAATGRPAAECGFTVFSRTYNLRAPRVGPRIGEGLPSIPARSGLYGGGRATFERVSNDDATTGLVSIATWMPVAARARLSLRAADKKEVAATEVEIPPFGQMLVPFPGRVTNGQLWVQLVKAPAQALFYPVVTLVNAATLEPTHLLATPSKKTAAPEWLQVHPGRLPIAPVDRGQASAARR
jgi:hypothetical protein